MPRCRLGKWQAAGRFWSQIRRLTWWMLLGGLVASCSAIKAVPGRISTAPDLTEDATTVWRDAYKRSDKAPLVYVVPTAELTCSGDVNGQPGFQCPTVGCRQGCTGSPFAVHLVDVLPRSAGVLAHELEHVVEIRDALAALLESPRTFEGYAALADRNHKGPAWQPGGAVDKANALLASRGR